MSGMPRLFVEQGYDVTLAVRDCNKELFDNNPYIAELVIMPDSDPGDVWISNWFEKEKHKYDPVINTSGHVEVAFLTRTDLDYGMWPKTEEARAKAKGVNYYDATYKACGFENAVGMKPEIHLSNAEKEVIEKNFDIKKGRKLVLWQLQGSTKSKFLVNAVMWINEVRKNFPDSVHYVWASDPNMANSLPKGVVNMWGKTTVRDSIRLIASADLVIGPESFMVNAAAAFNTPNIILYSHSLPENLASYYKNSMAIQPYCECHPCYLICINFRNVYEIWKRKVAREVERHCQIIDPNYEYRRHGFRCCIEIDNEALYKAVEVQLNGKNPRSVSYLHR